MTVEKLIEELTALVALDKNHAKALIVIFKDDDWDGHYTVIQGRMELGHLDNKQFEESTVVNAVHIY